MPRIFLQNYFTRGFWGDEAWTALISQFSLGRILEITSQDFHPPLYYFFVNLWGRLFGYTEVSLRTMSLIFFLLAVLVTYQLSKKLFEKPFSRLATTVLVGFSPILITYAFEARAYALLSFLSVSSTLVLLNIVEHSSKLKWKILYVILGSLSVYSHYYAWFILASHGLYLLFFQPKKIKSAILPALGILLIQLPWIPRLFSQVQQVQENYWISPISNRTHWEFFYRVVAGDTSTIFQIYLGIFFAILIGSWLFYLIYKAFTTKFSSFFAEHKASVFLFTWLLIPTIIPTIISLKLPVFFYRYLIFSSIPIIFLAVKALERLPRWMLYSALAIILGIYLYTDCQIMQKYPHTFRQEREELGARLDDTSTLYTVLPSFAEVMYYFGDTHQINVLPEGLIQASGKSLVDAFLADGEIELTYPEEESYYLLEPGPRTYYITDKDPDPEPLF